MQGTPESSSHPQTPPAPSNPEQAFAPLPLRVRGTLEILDVAVKVYKQYFWVLIGWSAIVSVASQVPYIAIFLWPLLIGSTVCCITAAVRGQAVKFNQCWRFTQPRYGPILGTAFFGLLVFIVLIFVLAFALIFTGALMATALQQLPLVLQIIGGVLLFLIFMLVMTSALVWLNVALVVVCMEERKSGSRAVGRAFELLRGHWIRVSTILTLLSIAMLLLMGILWAAGMAVFGISSLPSFASGEDMNGIWTFAIIGGVVGALIGTLWNPIFYLTLGLFYLDLRVRKEALDIEWGAHISTQNSPQVQPTPDAAPAVWAPESDLSLQHGQPSFRAALAGVQGVKPDQPPAPVPMTPEQQAWFGTPTPVSPETQSVFNMSVPAISLGKPNDAPPPVTTPDTGTTAPAPNSVSQTPPVAAAPPVAASSVVCSQCGSSSPVGQTFCMNCGARIQASPTGPSSSDSPSTPQW